MCAAVAAQSSHRGLSAKSVLTDAAVFSESTAAPVEIPLPTARYLSVSVSVLNPTTPYS